MQINVTFRHMDANDSLREYALEKVQRVRKYLVNPLEAAVTLTTEKHGYIAEVNILANRITINGKEKGDNMFSAIDLVMDKVERQVRKYKDKIQKHKQNSQLTDLSFRMDIIDSEGIEDDVAPKIVHTENLFAKPMSVDEAVMQLDLTAKEFLVFRNAETESVNVIYRRKDGNYGLIEMEST